MNSIIDIMMKRRSIRYYKQEDIPKDLLLELVKAAV